MKDQIKQLYKNNWRVAAIAKKLGKTHNEVARVVDQLKLSGELVDFYDMPKTIVHMMPCQILKQSDLGR